jgi:hypothetical protein
MDSSHVDQKSSKAAACSKEFPFVEVNYFGKIIDRNALCVPVFSLFERVPVCRESSRFCTNKEILQKSCPVENRKL